MEGSLLEKMPQVEDNLIFFLVVSCVQPLVENLTVDLFFFFYSFGTFYTNKCIINGDRIVLNMWYRKVSKYRYFWRPQCTGLENSFDVCLKGKALLFFYDDIFWHLPKNADIFYAEQSKISAFHMDFMALHSASCCHRFTLKSGGFRRKR